MQKRTATGPRRGGLFAVPLLARRGAGAGPRRAALAAAMVFGVGAALLPALGVRTLPLPAAPGRYATDDFAAALVHVGPYAEGGRVDYQALRDDAGSLARFVATSAVVGPKTTPERFPNEAARLAFALNAYNANVLAAVLAHYPIASVHDVRGPLEPTPGFGFFWALRVRIDGQRTNLYDYEHDVIRAFDDARVHAALNCASRGCPPLATRPFEARSLDAQLDHAMTRMVTLPENLLVDGETIRLSPLFDWYREDFVAHARRLRLAPVPERAGDEGWLLAFVLAFTDGEAQKSLEGAARSGRPVVYGEYDWGLNDLRR